MAVITRRRTDRLGAPFPGHAGQRARQGGSRLALATGLAVVLLWTPAVARAEGLELLPNVSVHLKGARYVPAEVDFEWTGWVGAGFDMLRIHRTTAYFRADVETILGRKKQPFDANQANYHLEAGLRVGAGGYQISPVFRHVSRHLIDEGKTQPVDWHVLGVRFMGRLPEGFPVPARFALEVGHTVHWRLVHYNWELLVLLDAEVVSRPWGRLYLRTDARLVTAESSPAMPRGSFLDLTAEGGLRFPRNRRTLDVFVAYEHRNDVFVLVPGSRDRALLGVRVGFAPEEVGPARR